MFEFRSRLQLSAQARPLSYAGGILCLGSCFAEHMALYLRERGYTVSSSPFGISYNPASLAQSLKFLSSAQVIEAQDLFEQDGLWHSWQHHGHLSAPEPEQALMGMNRALMEARAALSKTQVLILTLGTAWVYELAETGQIVNNCHRVPASKFKRRRLSLAEIIQTLTQGLEALRQVNPAIRVILTVSPVRHLKDGLEANQRSKALLLLATEQLCETLPETYYFPAYEILMDDLRDYRFYAADFCHPAPLALDYVWALFEQTWLDPAEAEMRRAILKLGQEFKHRPLHAQGPAYQNFLAQRERKLLALKARYPQADWENGFFNG